MFYPRFIFILASVMKFMEYCLKANHTMLLCIYIHMKVFKVLIFFLDDDDFGTWYMMRVEDSFLFLSIVRNIGHFFYLFFFFCLVGTKKKKVTTFAFFKSFCESFIQMVYMIIM